MSAINRGVDLVSLLKSDSASVSIEGSVVLLKESSTQVEVGDSLGSRSESEEQFVFAVAVLSDVVLRLEGSNEWHFIVTNLELERNGTIRVITRESITVEGELVFQVVVGLEAREFLHVHEVNL